MPRPQLATPARVSRSLLGVLVVALLVEAAWSPPVVPEAAAHRAETPGAVMTSARLRSAAVWDGSRAISFGGEGGGRQVVKYDPATNTVETIEDALPPGVVGTAAVWDGAHAYLFGGDGDPTRGDMAGHIVRYDTATDTATFMSATFPGERLKGAAAVWNGHHAYVFGGDGVESGHSDRIWRYDVVSDTLTEMGARLPFGRMWLSAAWTGTHALVFGGITPDFFETKQILRYDPATDTLEVLPTEIPANPTGTSAFWNGTRAFIFTGPTLRFDPETGRMDRLSSDPQAIQFASVAWDGRYAWVFGGTHPHTRNRILRFDPSADATTYMGAALSSAVAGAPAAWTGARFHLYGGSDRGSNENVFTQSFNPATWEVRHGRELVQGRTHSTAVRAGDVVVVLGGHKYGASTDSIIHHNLTFDRFDYPTNLPEPRESMSAVWDPRDRPEVGCAGGCVYAFGGRRDGGSVSDEILRYNPRTLVAQAASARLPTPRYFTNAVFDGAYAYVLGGVNATGAPIDEILRYDPVADALAVMNATVPGATRTAAAWDGERALLFGGLSGTTALARILAFDPGADATEVLDLRLPISGYDMAAGWDGRDFYVFGGRDGYAFRDRIVRVNLTEDGAPDAPRAIAAASGPGAGEITLTWTPPTHADHLVGYRVYGGDAPGEETLIAELGVVTRFTESGLRAGETRHYQVRAVNGAGAGLAAEASGTAPVEPGAPTSLAAEAGPGAREIALRWEPPIEDGGTAITGYRVYRGPDGANFSLVADLGVVPEHTDANLENGTSYYYRVSAMNGVGEGEPSNVANATTFDLPSEPLRLGATGNALTRDIALTWQRPRFDGGTPITSYCLDRRDGVGAWITARCDVPGSATSWIDHPASGPVLHTYRLRAENLVGQGPASNEASAVGGGPRPE